jgi:hypothetical protein
MGHFNYRFTLVTIFLFVTLATSFTQSNSDYVGDAIYSYDQTEKWRFTTNAQTLHEGLSKFQIIYPDLKSDAIVWKLAQEGRSLETLFESNDRINQLIESTILDIRSRGENKWENYSYERFVPYAKSIEMVMQVGIVPNMSSVFDLVNGYILIDPNNILFVQSWHTKQADYTYDIPPIRSYPFIDSSSVFSYTDDTLNFIGSSFFAPNCYIDFAVSPSGKSVLYLEQPTNHDSYQDNKIARDYRPEKLVFHIYSESGNIRNRIEIETSAIYEVFPNYGNQNYNQFPIEVQYLNENTFIVTFEEVNLLPTSEGYERSKVLDAIISTKSEILHINSDFYDGNINKTSRETQGKSEISFNSIKFSHNLSTRYYIKDNSIWRSKTGINLKDYIPNFGVTVKMKQNSRGTWSLLDNSPTVELLRKNDTIEIIDFYLDDTNLYLKVFGSSGIACWINSNVVNLSRSQIELFNGYIIK